MFISLIAVITLFIFILLSVAFFTVVERKVLAGIQRRKGPGIVGFFGVFQAFADGLKLFIKEVIIPNSSNTLLFILAPCFTFFLSLVSWSVMPFGLSSVIADVPLGVIALMAISSMGVYGIVVAGWSSNSNYAFLGSLRSTAQIISYEVSFGFILVCVLICSHETNLTSIVVAQKNLWFFFPLFPIASLFFISCLAETNRHPFDLPEAEAELVSG